MRWERERKYCAECQGPLGETYYDFDDHGEICIDCVDDWIKWSNDAPDWFLLIIHDDIDAGYRRSQPEL